MQILVRDAVLRDLPDLCRVRNTPDLHRENLDLADGVNRRFLVFLGMGQITAFSQILLRPPAHAPERVDFPKISDLYVEPALRGLGIGSSFVREMERIVQEMGHFRMYLGVDAENDRVYRLYLRLGYAPLHENPYPRRAIFYGDSGEAVERLYWRMDMAKDLPV